MSFTPPSTISRWHSDRKETRLYQLTTSLTSEISASCSSASYVRLARVSTMKTIIALVTTALLLASSPVEALDREMRLRVVSSVHANDRVLVTDQEERKRSHGNCVDDGTRNQDPVCASNGKKYLNMNRFEYNKCLIEAEEDEDITIVDLEFCRDAMMEDIVSEGLA